MKILLISGSPRKQGNTTNILRTVSDRVKDIMEVQTVNLSDLQVHGCLGEYFGAVEPASRLN